MRSPLPAKPESHKSKVLPETRMYETVPCLSAKKKLEQDEDYRDYQARSYESWKRRNPNYWKEYRKRNPEYTEKNRLLQKTRNLKRKQAMCKQGHSHKEIAKMESQEKVFSIISGYYKLTPVSEKYIANMEGTIVKIEIVSDD